MMLRPIWVTVLASVVVGVGVWYFARPADEVLDTPRLATMAQPADAIVAPASTTVPAAAVPPDSRTVDVQQLIADANGGDAARRAVAIAALARAPRATAVPALGRVLTDGEPRVDRPLALRSLQELAFGQGDADGKVREAIRAAIYHGDDDTQLAEVQSALDAVEASEARRANL